MRKTDKKLENQLRVVLTDVCDHMLTHVAGFQWLTHLVNYSQFPKSLKVVLIFDSNERLQRFLSLPVKDQVAEQIDAALSQIGLKLKNVNQHITYDTEENCERHNGGKWNERLK
ncbi:Fis family transcriptional regulator [Neiella sp. HB171785]|uniref:Fis family transcriptional regulator n=1 Tax=Neiella litorisoli TaxID=2771431 RepID=A0A8J6UPW5_9GAMM|nr:Fis family transcriptional regulator [Neiella litorisoli]MBD1389627.1 Fis family transcriptional regulator [Neiella litorisoli]